VGEAGKRFLRQEGIRVLLELDAWGRSDVSRMSGTLLIATGCGRFQCFTSLNSDCLPLISHGPNSATELARTIVKQKLRKRRTYSLIKIGNSAPATDGLIDYSHYINSSSGAQLMWRQDALT